MEEILASIRRIISEDGGEARDGKASKDAAPRTVELAPAPEALGEPAPRGDDDVLELTDVVDEHGNVVALEDAVERVPMAPGSAAPKKEAPAPQPRKPLVSPFAETAVSQAFQQVDRGVTPSRADQAAQRVTEDGRTIEDHVVGMLRPMLQEWLDTHLPHIVQRLVQREIDRISRRSEPE